jgi:hypothetical protein
VKATMDAPKDGGMVLTVDAEGLAAMGSGLVTFFSLVQNMAATLDRIARLPVVGVQFVPKRKGARRGKAKTARA